MKTLLITIITISTITCNTTSYTNREAFYQAEQIIKKEPNNTFFLPENSDLSEHSTFDDCSYYRSLTEQAILKKHDQTQLLWTQRIIFLFVLGSLVIFILKLKKEKKQIITNKEIEIMKQQKIEGELREYIFKKSEIFKRLSLFMTSDISPEEFSKTIETIRENPLKDKEWEIIFSEIDHAFNNFTTRLKMQYSALTSREIQLACLIRVNMDTTDISYIFQTLPNSVNKQKSRLRSTLNISKKRTCLYRFLANF